MLEDERARVVARRRGWDVFRLAIGVGNSIVQERIAMIQGDKAKILGIIMEAISEVNEMRAEKIPEDDISKVILYGPQGAFDSMGLVNFLLIVEDRLDQEFGASLSLTSERAVSRKTSPFRGVTHLADFILEEMQVSEAA